MGYSYYDSPEGEDCFKKLLYTTKIGTLVGLTASTFDVLLLSHPQGYYQTVARFGRITFPLVGMAAAFTSTVCVANSLRKKDDKLNYALGGIAAGCVGGAALKSVFNGFRLSAIFAIAAVVKKMSIEEGWLFFPPTVRQVEGIRRSQDYTLMKELPRNWTTGENQ